MKEHIPRKDFDVAVSPQMQSFIDKQLDASGIDPSTRKGFAKSHHIMSRQEAHPIASVEFPNENKDIAKLVLIPNENNQDVQSSLRIGQKLHSAIGQTVRKRIINHGDRITDLGELHNHLYNIHKTMSSYRRTMNLNLHDFDYLPEKDRFIYNGIPRKEQQQISNQIKRMLTHPEFNNQNTNKHLTPEHFANAHSMVHHLEGVSSMGEQSKAFQPMSDLFRSNIMTDPHVRHDFHNFLDQYETQGEPQKRVAAAIRGHMIKAPHKTGWEISHLITKYARDPNSIDLGRTGRLMIHGHESHPLNNQMMHGNDPRIAKLKETDPEIYRKHAWSTAPIGAKDIGSEHEHSDRVLNALTHYQPQTHTKKELIDMFGTIHHVLDTSPQFAHTHSRSYYTSETKSGDIKQRGIGALQKILASEDKSRFQKPRDHVENARKIIEARAAMKATGVIR